MNTRLFLKTLALVTALAVVIYVIQSLRSPQIQTQVADPNSVLGILVGSDQRLLNWCPQEVSKVELFTENGEVLKELTSKQDVSAVCELMVGGFSKEGTESPKFSVILKAYPISGAPVVLEQQAGSDAIFRFKGMPFSCPGLVKALGRLTAP